MTKCKASLIYLRKILPSIIDRSSEGKYQITFIEKNCKIIPKNDHYVVPEIERFYPEIKTMLEEEQFKVKMIIGEYSMKDGPALPPVYKMNVDWY